jgi:XRE family aerobic/anaerobic benzoate catabolism transcriptional regulator
MATDIRVSLGKRIRELRKARQWRQIDLAAHSGLNAIYICDVERGEKQLCLFAIEKLAAGLGISISELFRGL